MMAHRKKLQRSRSDGGATKEFSFMTGIPQQQHQQQQRVAVSCFSPIALTRIVVFLVAFWIGHYCTRVPLPLSSTYNDDVLSLSRRPPSSSFATNNKDNDNDGWRSIHVFYGNTRTTTTTTTTTTSSNDDDDKGIHKEQKKQQQQQKHYLTKHWHSQVGQDELVMALLSLHRKSSSTTHGYYYYYVVDLAANDAVHWSNTYALEEQHENGASGGWTGLCIEPTPRYWHDLIVQRNCHAVGAVVGNASRRNRVQWKRRREYSGIVGPDFDNVARQNRALPIKYTVPLAVLFDKFKVPQHVDYLSLDVEGAEEYVLRDFLTTTTTSYTFSIMTIERPSRSLMDLLTSRGYVYLATLSDWGETIWAHPSLMLDHERDHGIMGNNDTALQLLKHYQDKYEPWKPAK